jgi:acyl-coenzyme A synthetase/AMP-(fatty) acid ligase
MLRYPDEEAGQVPIAFVVRRPGSDLNENQIIDFMSDKVNYNWKDYYDLIKIYLFFN